MNPLYVFQDTIAVDLDGCLIPYIHIEYHHLMLPPPIPSMAKRVNRWLDDGHKVMIFTARLAHEDIDAVAFHEAIKEWTTRWFKKPIEATCTKYPFFIEFWDDRAVAVEQDTGRRLSNNSRLERD